MDLLETVYNTPVARRPPHWRWAVAHSCSMRPRNYKGKRITRNEDRFIFESVDYMRMKRSNPAAAIARYRPLYEAESIYFNASPMSEKWAIEAWLCAKASDEEIAARFCLDDPKTVTYYKRLYFDIEYYQENDVQMFLNVMSPAKKSSDPGDDYQYVWKMVGYKHGVAGLCDLFACFMGTPLPNQLKQWMNEISRDRMNYMTFVFAQDPKNLKQQSAQFALDTASRNGSIKEQVEDSSDGDLVQQAAKHMQACMAVMVSHPDIPVLQRQEFNKHELLSNTTWEAADDIQTLHDQAFDGTKG